MSEIIPPEQAQQIFTEHGVTAYRQLNHSRPYALDETGNLALASSGIQSSDEMPF